LVSIGYKPCDPQIVSDRISHMTAAFEELKQLSADRLVRLGESRKMWQFYADMADEEGWIKEKEQIMSSPDLGHDLTSVQLLLTKFKVTDICWLKRNCFAADVLTHIGLFHLSLLMLQLKKECGHSA